VRSYFRRRDTDAARALSDFAADMIRYREQEGKGRARAAIVLRGRWEGYVESGPGTSIERIDRRFRAAAGTGAEGFGVFRADFATFGEAWDGAWVLEALLNSLVSALGWPADPRMPDLGLDSGWLGATYFRRRARDGAGYVLAKGASIVTTPLPLRLPPHLALVLEDVVDGGAAQLYVVTVRRKSIVLACYCTTRERADFFLPVLDALADDLIGILDWKPLEE